jgi:hypothetical protein
MTNEYKALRAWIVWGTFILFSTTTDDLFSNTVYIVCAIICAIDAFRNERKMTKND